MARNHLKSFDGQRLIWWGEPADEKYWHNHFSQQIVRSNARANLEQRTGVIPILRRYLPDRGRILEAGCGTGWVVNYLQRRGYEVEGVDYSEELVRRVLEEYPDLPVWTGDVCDLDVPDGCYQGYVSLGVIEHRREGPEPFLREAYRVVAPGGTVCISVPFLNPLRQLKSRLGAYKAEADKLPFYQYGYSKLHFRTILEEQGFAVRCFEFYGTNRCLEEELAALYEAAFRRRGLWRIKRHLDRLDSLGLAPHMVMAIAHRV